MGNCFEREDTTESELQSVIFHRNKVYKKEVIMWDEKRAISYMSSRGWVWCPPPDITKHDQIRLHIEQEDKYENLEYQDVGSAITLVMGRKSPPQPRRKFLLVNSYKNTFVKSTQKRKGRSNIHTFR